MEKHTPYFKVLETLQKAKDCALCVLEKEAVHSYFEAFLYENVNDPGARDSLRESRGYCPHHAHQLAGFHDTLALSILYKDQMLLAASFLEKAGSHGNVLKEWGKHSLCPACFQTIQIRHHYAGILKEGLVEPEMREAFLGNFHACLNHLLIVMDGFHDEAFKRELALKMKERLIGLAGRLEQYCQDGQKIAKAETFESPHGFAWREALEIATGQKGVFEPWLK
jgi:hypothetical protein